MFRKLYSCPVWGSVCKKERMQLRAPVPQRHAKVVVDIFFKEVELGEGMGEVVPSSTEAMEIRRIRCCKQTDAVCDVLKRLHKEGIGASPPGSKAGANFGTLFRAICLDDLPLSYADVVGAVDGVITKPGYGIVSDCLAHGTPVIYVDRGFFAEYDILVQEMGKQLSTVYLSSPDFYAGRWQAAIQALEKLPRVTPTLPCNGAEVCAEIILNFLDTYQ